MNIAKVAEQIAALVAAIEAADDQERRQTLTGLYTALQAAGLSEPVAGALQHQIARAADSVKEGNTNAA